MDVLDNVMAAAPRPRAKTAPKPGPSRSLVQSLEMPERPPCTASEQGETVVISVYMSSRDRAKGKFWLRRECADWLLSYAADELHLQGVTRTSAEPACSLKANCTAVADLNLEWDFGAKAWNAEFVSGPFKGETRRLCVGDLSSIQRCKGRDLTWAEGDMSGHSSVARKDAAKEIITRWCRAIASNEGKQFEKEWGLQERVLETPQKRRRGSHAPGTADAESD